MRRYAFTMIELVFVIVIMGILAKFGAEFLAQAYNGFIFSKINNELQSKSEIAVEEIAARLQYRIKDSTIGRDPDNSDFNTNFKSLSEINTTEAHKYGILEWTGVANESFRGNTTPLWSGIIDIDESNVSTLVSPETNTTAVNDFITALKPSGSTTTFDDSAIFFIGSTSNVHTGFGWDKTHHDALYPIHADSANVNYLVSDSNFSGVDVYEYNQLAWTAYAIGIDDYNTTTHMGTLKLWYDYQPWAGEDYDNNGTSVTLMENVSTFRYSAVGSLLKIQVCTKSTYAAMSEGNYSICKEKTVY